MDRENPTRRRFLRAGGLLGTAALAGCTGSSDEGTPPDVGTMTELDPVGPVNVVTTFDGAFVPEFWSFMGGPADAVGATPTRAMDGESSLYCRLGSSDHQVAGIRTSPEGFPMEDGDSFFAWTYVAHDDAQVEFGLTAALDVGDANVALTVPSLYRSSDGIVYRQADGDQLAETTLSTEFGAGRWIRFGMTVYPSTDEIRYSVADEHGRHQRTDRVPMNASFIGEYSIYAVGHHHQDAEIYVDRITAGPYRKSVDVGTTDRSGGLDQDRLTADGYPQVTLNRFCYVDDAMPSDAAQSMAVATAEQAPARAVSLNAVSVCADYDPPAYYEEYRTAYGAERRLSMSAGKTMRLFDADSEVEKFATEDVDGYPNEWTLLENDRSVYALSRAGSLIAGGYVSKETYLDPVDTLVEQLRTGELPEDGGMAQHPMAVLPAFGDRYGHEQLDLGSATAASVPMDEFSESRAREILLNQYDAFDADDLTTTVEADIDGYPVDSYDAYRIIVDIGSGRRATVVSWASTEFAQEFATKVIRGGDWTYDAHYPGEDYKESNLGPFERDGVVDGSESPIFGFETADGVQRLRKAARTNGGGPYPTYDVFSGNVTVVR